MWVRLLESGDKIDMRSLVEELECLLVDLPCGDVFSYCRM